MELNENLYLYKLSQELIKEYITYEYSGTVLVTPAKGNELKLQIRVLNNGTLTEFEIDLSKVTRAIPFITYLLPLLNYLMEEIDSALEYEPAVK